MTCLYLEILGWVPVRKKHPVCQNICQIYIDPQISCDPLEKSIKLTLHLKVAQRSSLFMNYVIWWWTTKNTQWTNSRDYLSIKLTFRQKKTRKKKQNPPEGDFVTHLISKSQIGSIFESISFSSRCRLWALRNWWAFFYYNIQFQ